MVGDDPFDLGRFVAAQAGPYEAALAELRAGHKRSHWMWFVFPQMRGLGASPMAQRYGIATRAEACAFLAHPVLGERLRACTRAVLATRGLTRHDIFGAPDDAKFASSMTLFAAVAAGDDAILFREALDRFCAGRADGRTLHLLGEG